MSSSSIPNAQQRRDHSQHLGIALYIRYQSLRNLNPHYVTQPTKNWFQFLVFQFLLKIETRLIKVRQKLMQPGRLGHGEGGESEIEHGHSDAHKPPWQTLLRLVTRSSPTSVCWNEPRIPFPLLSNCHMGIWCRSYRNRSLWPGAWNYPTFLLRRVHRPIF